MTNIGISQDLGVERPTVLSHLEYLESAFLVSKSNFYSNRLATESQEIGLVAETLAFDHTRRLKFFLSDHQNVDVFYWYSNAGEVNMVLDAGVPVPIEVKYHGKISDSDTSAVSGSIKNTSHRLV